MEGRDSSKVRRGSNSAIYEKYLNIKNNALPKEDQVAKECVDISNSTDEQELEAGEVFTGVSMKKTNDGRDMTSSRIEVRGGPSSSRMNEPAESPRMMGGAIGARRERSRSRSRGRNGNGMRDDMNGNRPWQPPQGPLGNGRFEGPYHGGNEHFGAPSPRGRFDGRPGSPGFDRRPGSPGFDRRPGSPPRDDYNGRLASPPRGGYNGRPGSPQRNGFGGGRSPARHNFGGGRSPPRDSFGGGRDSPRRDEFYGPPGGFRGRSLPREDFRRGHSMSPRRDGPPRGFRDGLGPGRDSPRGRMMGGHGPGGPRRSRSRSPFFHGSPRGPPRDGNGYGRLDGRPRSGSPGMMGMGGRRSPSRNGSNGPPPFDDRGPSSMGRPLSPPRGGDFGPRFGPSSGREGPFRSRDRSRSPNRPPSSEMMPKRDRSWERGGPLPNTEQRPFNGPLPDSPSMMEPRPYDTPSEWSFELRRSGKVKCRCSATSFSVGISRQLPSYLDVVTLPHLRKSPEFLQLDRPNITRVVYELKPESMADASGYREFVEYLIQGRGGHARAGAATEMEPQGYKIFLLPPGQAARQIGYKGDHMVAVLRSR